jgi:hypothetical protein
VQKAFEKNGIDFAHREVRVNIPGLEQNTEQKPEQIQAVAAATGQVVNIAADQQKTIEKEDGPF